VTSIPHGSGQKAKIATGLAWPEGPTVLADGRLVFVEVYRSRVSVIDPSSDKPDVAEYMYTGGGPNATTLGSDGAIYITQSGGVVGPWRAPDRRSPSIQRITGSGTETLVTEIGGIRFQAPNDLCFGADGRLYFTDPGRYEPETRPDPGYVFALGADGVGEVLAEMPPCYPNGIAAEADGGIVWVESYTRLVKRWTPGSGIEECCLLPDGHVPDGLAIAEDGTFYITSTGSGGLDIVGADGSYLGFLEVGGIPTNCAFAGSSLFVTDGGHTGTTTDAKHIGVLWRIETQTRGLPLFAAQLG
jgi:gluconolactonase